MIAALDPFHIALVSVGAIMLFLFAVSISSRIEKRRAAQAENETRKQWVFAKYGDTDEGRKIYLRKFWAGMTSDQLLDSIGRPLDIDDKVTKRTRRQVWKYDHRGANRYGLRVTIENGVVTGWDVK